MKIFKGIGTALITPFDENFNVDTEALKNLTGHIIKNDGDFLVALGTTSEAPTLSRQEKELVLDTITKTNNNRLPVVVGIGGNNTKKVVEEINYFASKYDFQAVLSVCPYYNKPNQRGLYKHFATIAEATDKNIIIYNVPGRTSSDILPETVLELARNYKNIIAIKEASGKIERGMDIIQGLERNDFSVLSGDDPLFLAELSVGYDGVISVITNAYPKEFAQMRKELLQGNFTQAHKYHYALYTLIKLIFREGNPTGIKALLKLKGIINTDNLRLPLVSASGDLKEALKQALI